MVNCVWSPQVIQSRKNIWVYHVVILSNQPGELISLLVEFFSDPFRLQTNLILSTWYLSSDAF